LWIGYLHEDAACLLIEVFEDARRWRAARKDADVESSR